MTTAPTTKLGTFTFSLLSLLSFSPPQGLVLLLLLLLQLVYPNFLTFHIASPFATVAPLLAYYCLIAQ